MENKLSVEEQHEFLELLKARFHKYPERHEGITWDEVQKKLEENEDKLWSLHELERTGGEPDVIGYDEETGKMLWIDCSKETPKERRSICYDRAALEARKKHKPETSAWDLAHEMGVSIATEKQYRQLQSVGEFDLKTSSWINTPDEIRVLGGALFCDRRYNKVFVYHNGADSYYGSRSFRGVVLL